MKKFLRTLTVSICTAVLLSAGALAASSENDIKPYRLYNVYVEHTQTSFLNEQGLYAYPISYQDSIYIPLRTVGEWMGKNVTWEQASKTVVLSGNAEKLIRDAYAAPPLSQKTYVADPDPRPASDVSVVLDGAAQRFQNESGQAISPIMSNDMVYLPVRSVGELMGMEVGWKSGVNWGGTVFLRTEMTALEKQQGIACLDTLIKAYEPFSITDGMRVDTLADAKTMLDTIEAALNETTAVNIPNIPLLADFGTDIKTRADNARIALSTARDALAKSSTLLDCGASMREAQHTASLVYAEAFSRRVLFW